MQGKVTSYFYLYFRHSGCIIWNILLSNSWLRLVKNVQAENKADCVISLLLAPSPSFSFLYFFCFFAIFTFTPSLVLACQLLSCLRNNKFRTSIYFLGKLAAEPKHELLSLSSFWRVNWKLLCFACLPKGFRFVLFLPYSLYMYDVLANFSNFCSPFPFS